MLLSVWRILGKISHEPLPVYAKRIVRNAIRRWLIPWRRSVDIWCGAALGDTLMCTPAIRALKQANPGCRIHFYTDYPDVVRSLSYLDEISPTEKRPRKAIWMGYEGAFPQSHLAWVLGKRIGVCVKDVRPDCHIDEKLVEQARST